MNSLRVYIILLLCCGLFLTCNFNETNIDPTRSTDAALKEILPAALTQTAHNLSSIGARVTGTVVQHYEGIDAHPESYTQYLIDEKTLNVFWRNGLYAGAMKDCQLLIQKAGEAEQYHYRGIAKILMAINLGIATSFWGEVPYSEAFQGLDNLQPRYDSQEKIYETIENLLKDAIEDLQSPWFANAPEQDDLIFSGMTQYWISTAHALRARYFLHQSKRHNQAAQEALKAIQAGAFSTLKEQANFKFTSHLNEANPIALYWFERPDQMVMSTYLFELLTETQDPRLARFCTTVNGLPMLFHPDSSQLYWGQLDAPLPLLSLTELKFIQAEALLRQGENEAALQTFQAAVIAHFEQMNIPLVQYESFIQAHIHFDNCPSFEQKLEWLIQQKHLALFAQNPIEAWVDFRRTGFPRLSAPTSANPSFNPSLSIPQRYLYPQSERTSNQQHRNEAIERQGGHFLDVPIWLFQD